MVSWYMLIQKALIAEPFPFAEDREMKNFTLIFHIHKKGYLILK